MIDHISIGVRNIDDAKKFYDAVFMPLGYSCLTSGADYLGYGKKSTAFWVGVTRTPVPKNPKSGLHFCVTASTRASVRAFHKAALATGGRDNGKPGLRKDYGPNYYAAFIVDPDGYRLEAVCHARS